MEAFLLKKLFSFIFDKAPLIVSSFHEDLVNSFTKKKKDLASIIGDDYNLVRRQNFFVKTFWFDVCVNQLLICGRNLTMWQQRSQLAITCSGFRKYFMKTDCSSVTESSVLDAKITQKDCMRDVRETRFKVDKWP